MTTEFQRTFDADLAQLADAVAALADWTDGAGLDARGSHHLQLAIEELATNAIIHGLAGRPGRIALRLWSNGAVIQAELRDDAPPFDPFAPFSPFAPVAASEKFDKVDRFEALHPGGVPPPDLTAGIDERTVGGLGVHLVRTLIDEWHYRRDGDENVVTLRHAMKEKDA